MVRLDLVTLAGTILSENVHEILLPTPLGQIAVFKNHAPLVTIATTGVISVRRKDNLPDDMLEHFAIDSGVIEIADNVVRVLVDEAEKASDISAKEAEDALKRAKQLRSEAKDQVSLDKAQSLVDRHTTRLKVAGLRRRHRH